MHRSSTNLAVQLLELEQAIPHTACRTAACQTIAHSMNAGSPPRKLTSEMLAVALGLFGPIMSSQEQSFLPLPILFAGTPTSS